MEVDPRIISTEIIKPAAPTPHHLKTHKLSMIDQLLLYSYYPIIFFYSEADNKNSMKISEHLKRSLSKILVHYYPFAGRVKDDYSIDCDDYGVPFVEAHIASKMSDVLERPESMKERLIPFNLNEEVNLAIQLNHFDCGGVAICAYFRHVVADATSAENFLKNWATIAANGSNDIKDVTFVCTSIFPPRDLMASFSKNYFGRMCSTECITKRFTFDGSKIAALREEIISHGLSWSYQAQPTRFEAVAAVIWGASIAIARESNEPSPLAMVSVDLRKRMNPPLPSHCLGNILLPVTTDVMMKMEEAMGYDNLAKQIHESVKMVNDDYVRKVKEDDAFVNYLLKLHEEAGSGSSAKIFGFTSWCSLAFYEIDFGWGKPKWVTNASKYVDSAILLDTCDGQGIEAWVGLSESDMAKFEKDPGILMLLSIPASELQFLKSKVCTKSNNEE